jgi:hypothetical protein
MYMGQEVEFWSVSSRNRSETARQIAQQVRADGDCPTYRREYPLHGNSGQVITSVQKDAVREAGRDPEDPGEATHWWYRDLDIIVIDLKQYDD